MSRYAKEQARYRALDVLYAELPSVECKGLCVEECSALTPIKGAEARRIGHKGHGERTMCAHLKDGRCTVYERRPMVCRLWGLADGPPLVCRWGCRPSRALTLDEADEYLRQARLISEGGS